MAINTLKSLPPIGRAFFSKWKDKINEIINGINGVDEEIGTDETADSILGRISILENGSEWREATDEDYARYGVEFNTDWKTVMAGYINEKSKLMYFRNATPINLSKSADPVTVFVYITNLGNIKPIIEKASVSAYNAQDSVTYTYAVATFNNSVKANASINSNLLNTDSTKNYLLISLLAAL